MNKGEAGRWRPLISCSNVCGTLARAKAPRRLGLPQPRPCLSSPLRLPTLALWSKGVAPIGCPAVLPANSSWMHGTGSVSLATATPFSSEGRSPLTRISTQGMMRGYEPVPCSRNVLAAQKTSTPLAIEPRGQRAASTRRVNPPRCSGLMQTATHDSAFWLALFRTTSLGVP